MSGKNVYVYIAAWREEMPAWVDSIFANEQDAEERVAWLNHDQNTDEWNVQACMVRRPCHSPLR